MEIYVDLMLNFYIKSKLISGWIIKIGKILKV